jgi:RimJ/RimL family protein N-acetyltransferase
VRNTVKIRIVGIRNRQGLKIMQEGLSLSKLRDEDKLPLFELINDPEFIASNPQIQPVDWASYCQWFSKLGEDNSERVFAIGIPPNRTVVGVLDIKNIHAVHRSAEISIRLSDDTHYQDVGRTALSEAVEFCWRELNLNRLYMHAMSTNKQTIRNYLAVGFEIEGTLRAHSFFNSQYHDFDILGLLRTDNV